MLPVSAVPTKETAVIGRWLCRRYNLEGAATHGMKISLWVTKDVTLNTADFAKLMAGFGQQAGAEWLQAYLQIDGFPVAQEVSSTRGGAKQVRRSEVTAIDILAPPDDTYLPPDGFKKTTPH
jgi:hypothetical protein